MNENPREPKLDQEYRSEVKMGGVIEYDDSEKFFGGVYVRLREIASRMKTITENLPTLKNNIKALETSTQGDPSNNAQLLVIAREELARAEKEFAELLEESRKLGVSVERLEEIKRKRAVRLDTFPTDNPQ